MAYDHWYKSKIARINIAWGLIIFAGISSFIVARNAVLGQRKRQMKIHKEVEAIVQKEIEAKALEDSKSK